MEEETDVSAIKLADLYDKTSYVFENKETWDTAWKPRKLLTQNM